MGILGTAVVTGASSGIGKVYAERLAARGYDLYLVARRGDRLEALAQELKGKHDVQVTNHVADLGDAADLERVAAAIAADEQVTMLVNNAGTSVVGPLDSSTPEQMTALIQLNVVALRRLAMAVFPGFKQRNRGVIINLGSAVGFDGYPYTPIYGATKGYVQNLSLSLQNELAGTEVHVQLVAPAATVSEIWDVQGYPLSNIDPATVMSTEDCVDAALAGLDRKERITAPSVQDEAAITRYLGAGSALFAASQQTGKPAPRYLSR